MLDLNDPNNVKMVDAAIERGEDLDPQVLVQMKRDMAVAEIHHRTWPTLPNSGIRTSMKKLLTHIGERMTTRIENSDIHEYGVIKSYYELHIVWLPNRVTLPMAVIPKKVAAEKFGMDLDIVMSILIAAGMKKIKPEKRMKRYPPLYD